MTFRPVNEADLAAVRAICVEAAVWLKSRGIAQWNPDDFTDETMRADFERHRLYALIDGESLVGTFRLQTSDLAIWPDAATGEALYLHCLVVARTHAGEGLGHRLLDEACALVRAEGGGLLRLDCWAGNAALRNYYQSQGFRFCGEIAEADWRVARFEREV